MHMLLFAFLFKCAILVAMTHIRYPKIHRLGKSENIGILDRHVLVQEKIDGANLSIWMDNNYTENIRVGSRSQDVTEKGFNGAVDYVYEHEGIKKLLAENQNYRLFGEWLVPHTIKNYRPTAYKQFYLYDIMVEGEFLPQDIVEQLAMLHDINYPKVFMSGNLTEEEIMECVGKTNIGEKGEGVVIKPSVRFDNEWGDKNVYAKIVTEAFKEDNGVTFGGNNKHSETYHEMYICNKYMTISRCQKMMNKLSSEGVVLDKSCTSRFISQVYHDLITEECWEIANSGKTINFQALGRVCKKKAQVMFHALLDGHDSVAYK